MGKSKITISIDKGVLAAVDKIISRLEWAAIGRSSYINKALCEHPLIKKEMEALNCSPRK